MKRNYIILFIGILLLSGCSIKQEVNTIKQPTETEISIIENKKVREGVLPAYREVLAAKGYKVTLLPDGTPIPKTGLSTTYLALWSWDLGIYMSYAVFEVFNNGVSIGKAEYDSRSAGLNSNKFIKGEEKVKELANILFPSVAGVKNKSTSEPSPTEAEKKDSQ